MNEIKKYGGYAAVLIVGLLLGYVFFSGGSADEMHAHSNATEQVYSCSMHPKVQQNETGSCPICGMDLVVSNSGGITLDENQFQMTENALALANIETTTVGVGNMNGNTLKLSGKITANEKTNAVQTSIFDGRIEKLNVNYVGQYIKKGKQLGTMYSPELYSAQDKLLTSASYKDSHEKLFAAARNTLGVWKLTDAQINEILSTKKPIMNFPITATVNGTVTEVIGAEGNWYKQGDPLFKVSNLYTVWAVFDAYENQLPLLKVGQEIAISSNTFSGKSHKAKIDFIDPILDNDKRTVSLRATLINKEGVLKPGMFIEGSVQAEKANQVMTVPKSAVLWTGKRSLVYLKPDPSEPIFEMTEVTLGNAMGDSYVIVEGLAPGDEVVTNGTFTVDAAAQLQGKKSMMGFNGMEGMLIGDSKMNMEGDPDLKEKFMYILMIYDEMKNALVGSNATKANSDGRQLVSELAQLEGLMLDGMLTSRINALEKFSKKIAATDDLKKQREAFKPLSEAVIAIASSFNDLDQPIYVQHCPMADNNKGADWLSFQDKVQNPYYGDAMLTCGSVTKTLQ
ncbi:efflux RND transporter periplasmic adaptor subunit [Aggregatimonas sangjinii]|uniref:Efflux RND transporter periplasmic adaptor subunit n=1 Tax=Aggregatimonas sangjinii TaxID=2583587 RepID=A0A5B7SPG3_9FLAO|nr:efflux RND transporter periplasmic adaptor subunit [Aggregatimonas sangjinii]QCW98917.1 efflux RND transporter periplasmic adaptor subunit [Aggregatimonas sangjinii]